MGPNKVTKTNMFNKSILTSYETNEHVQDMGPKSLNKRLSSVKKPTKQKGICAGSSS